MQNPKKLEGVACFINNYCGFGKTSLYYKDGGYHHHGMKRGAVDSAPYNTKTQMTFSLYFCLKQ